MTKITSYWDSTLVKSSVYYLRFRECHTALNSLFWSLELGNRMACKKLVTHKPDDLIADSIYVTADDSRRFPPTFGDWKKSIGANQSWIRVNALISINAYFERYLHEITTLALLADPGILIGCPRTINGLIPLKKNISPKGLEIVREFTSGEWPKRSSALSKYLKFDTPLNSDWINDLDRIRIIRNKYAHRFGYSFSDLPSISFKDSDAKEGVSHNKLIDNLRMIEEFAKYVDTQLLKNHIGAFGIHYFWHVWDKKDVPKERQHDFQKLMYGVVKHLRMPPMPKPAARQLLSEYKSIT